jgi:hypothetical protein
VEDTGPFRGSVKPVNDAYHASKADFIFLSSDDAPFDVGWWRTILREYGKILIGYAK